MPQCPIKQPAALLPHSGRMVLLDEVLSYDSNSLHAVCTIRPDCILLPDGANALPGWLGLEIMAQGVGAWAGAHALDAGRPVQLGFLLGTRKLHFARPEIPVGTVLDVQITLSWQDNATNMGVFDCTLACRTPHPGCDDLTPGTLLLSGALNVFTPSRREDLDAILGR